MKKQQSAEKTTKKQRIVGRPFPKGVSGNPDGRPPGTFSLITLLKQELQKCPDGQDKKTYADLIIKRMLKESIEKGDIQQIKLIWNYIEGMPKQDLNIKADIKQERLEEVCKATQSILNEQDKGTGKEPV